MFKAITIFLDGGNIIANGLGALDIGSQEVLRPNSHGPRLPDRAGCGGEFPTVGSQGNIREDKKSHAAENDPLPHCEIAPHQLLE
jgi:hypothetical protein